MKPINEKIRNLKVMTREIGKYSIAKSIPVENIKYKVCEYKVGSVLPSTDDFVPFTKDMRWGKVRDSHAWFSFTVNHPEEYKNEEIKLSISTGLGNCWDAVNPQFIAYVDGHIRQGMDTNHTYIMLGGKDSYDIMIYAYSGMENERKDLLFDVQIVIENEDVFCVWQNFYDKRNKITDISLDFFEKQKDNYVRYHDEFSERAYTNETLCELLEKSGFKVEAIYGEDSYKKPLKTSERNIFVARKVR
jgi:hypothetical protein